MSSRIESIEDLLYEELRDIYDAEKQMTRALPKLGRAAASGELRKALEEHLRVTQTQVARLESVFEVLNRTASSKTCAGMKGLITEGKEAIEEEAAEPLADAAIIAAARRVEHYEIAAYSMARTLAEMINNQQAVELLQQTLDEEKEADQKLAAITTNLLENYTSGNDALGGVPVSTDETQEPEEEPYLTTPAGTETV